MNMFSKMVVFAIVNIIAIQHAAAQEFIRFENRWIPAYQIHNQTGPVTSGVTQPGWYSAQWLTEPVTESGVTYYRLKNRWKGAYLHSQNSGLELGPVEPDWTSAMWVFEKTAKPGYYRVQNRDSKEYLHVQTGSLGLGAIQPNWVSAHWRLLGYTGNGSAPVPDAPATVAQGTVTITQQADEIAAPAPVPNVVMGDAQITADNATPPYVNGRAFRDALAAWRVKDAAADARFDPQIAKAAKKMDDTVFWQAAGGSFRQISAGDRYVWAIDAEDKVFIRPVDGSGAWTQTSMKLMHISATGAGWIWAVRDDGAIMKCRKPCASDGTGLKTVRDWPRADDPAVKLTGGPDYVWALTTKQHLLRRSVDGSGAWQASPGQVINTLAAAPDGQLLIGQSNGDPFKCQSPCDGVSTNWSRVPRSPSASFGVLSIASNATSVVSASTDGIIWRRPSNDETGWRVIPGYLKTVALSPTDHIWGLGFDGGAFRTTFEEMEAARIQAENEAAIAQQQAANAAEAAQLQTASDAMQANAIGDFKPYYHTVDTKSCEIGSAGYTWTYHTPSGVRLISAMGSRLSEYFLPTRTGIAGRYHHWGRYGDKGFIGAEGYNWTADFDRIGQSQLVSANGSLIYVRDPGLSANGVEYEVAGAWGAPGYTWAADFTGDGRADIASASGNKVTMRIKTESRKRNEGFRLETWNVAGRWGDAAYTFVGDFNNDGKADIASGYGSTMYMSISTGAGFKDDAWQAPLAWGGAGYSWVGDFDGDGFVDDIATANGGSVSIAFSNGNGFDVRTGKIPNQWGQAGYAWAADFDRDGKTDIASANNCSVAYMRSDGLNFSLKNWKLELANAPRCRSVFADLGRVQEYDSGLLDAGIKSLKDWIGCR